MKLTNLGTDELNLLSRDTSQARERRTHVEAYMLEFDLAVVMQAEADRDPATSAPFREWAFESMGGVTGERIPARWLPLWPSRAVAPPSDREPTAWIGAAGYCVKPEVKDIIETLAPGVHQFIPLVLEAGLKSRRCEYPYFSIHVADRADDVIVGKSNVDWIKSKHGTYWSKNWDKPICLPAKSIVGKHIWWNRRCNILLISSELHDQLVSQGLASGLKFQKQIVE